MVTGVCKNEWDGSVHERRAWIDAMYDYGIDCRFDVSKAGDSVIADWHNAGQVGIGRVELSWLCLSRLHRSATCFGENLYLKIVRSGSLAIEQNAQMRLFGPGSMILVDPARSFKEYYTESTRVAILGVPRNALRDRGLGYSFDEPHVPDLASQDIRAVREFVLCTTRQAGATSERLLERFGEQCLDLLDVVVNDPPASARECASAITVLRTKQVIVRLLADPQLSVARIASELNVSASYLTRTLRANGLSPMRYAWSLRLEHAARLLSHASTRGMQAKEVAYRCGFASAAHFSRAFKERYDMSPRAFATYSKLVGATTVDSLSNIATSDASSAEP
jgi:AraC-like DNA-binding protein